MKRFLFIVSVFVCISLYPEVPTEEHSAGERNDVTRPQEVLVQQDEQKPATRRVVDATLATIYHPEGTVLICQSDLKADLSERVPSLREAVLKELIVLDGKKLQIPVTDDEIDRALARVQEHLHMTRDELIEFFKKQGYTLKTAKKELEKTIMVENVIEARVKTKAHVPQKAIEQYHKDNPDIRYGLKQAFIPFTGGSRPLARALIEQQIESGDILTAVQWDDIGEIKDEDFATDKAFIKKLPEGTIAISSETDAGTTLLQLQYKNVATFEHRKNDIANMLGQQRFMTVQNTYFEKLLKDANVRHHRSTS